MKVFDIIEAYGIIPVIKLDNAEDAAPLGEALINGGLPLAEVTFRTAAAEKAIAEMKRAHPEMTVGAGTVLTVEQAKKAVAAGAEFIVSPGLSKDVVGWCLSEKIPVIPGVCTPGELEQALALGLNTVKFFPAEAAGGLAMMKAMSAPYGGVRFVPTGGIDMENIAEYAAFPSTFAVGGSFMVRQDALAKRDFASVTSVSREALRKIHGFSIDHIGINSSDENEARRAAVLFEAVFGLEKTEGASSLFCGEIIELMKETGRGEKGHIAIGTYNPDRTAKWLAAKGIAVDEASRKTDKSGRTVFVYLKDEFFGFGIHLVKTVL